MTERVRAAAGIVAAVVAGVALLVWGAVVVTMLVRDQPVPWSEVTLAVTTVAGALGALFVRPPARRAPQKAGEVDAGELARVLRARRKSGSGLARADVAGIVVTITAAALAIALIVSSQGCAGVHVRSDAPATTRTWTGLACTVVDAVCGSSILPSDAQRWCAVAQLACMAGSAVAVAVVEGLADPPPPSSDVAAAGKTGRAPALAQDLPGWRAACEAGERAEVKELAPACEAVLSGDAAGAVIVPVP